MAPRKIIHFVSAGTSLYNNVIRNSALKELLRDINEGNKIIPDLEGDIRLLTEKNITDGLTDRWKELFRNLKLDDMKRFSAEINAMAAFLTSNRVNLIYFFPTGTPDAEFSHSMIEAWLQKEYPEIEIRNRKVDLTDPRDPENVKKGLISYLRQFYNALKEHIEDHNRGLVKIYINATGGFKNFTQQSVMIGAIMNVPAYYVFEAMRSHMLLPYFPIKRVKFEGLRRILLRRLFDEGVPATENNTPDWDRFGQTLPDIYKTEGWKDKLDEFFGMLDDMRCIDYPSGNDEERIFTLSDFGSFIYEIYGDLNLLND